MKRRSFIGASAVVLLRYLRRRYSQPRQGLVAKKGYCLFMDHGMAHGAGAVSSLICMRQALQHLLSICQVMASTPSYQTHLPSAP